MPTVPRLNNRVQSTGSPGVRVNTQTPIGTFGGDTRVNKAASGLADTAFKAVLDERNKADEVMVKDAYANLTTWRNEYVANAKTQKGKNAQGLPEDMNKQFQERNNEIKKGLNGRQVASYDKLAQSVYLDTDSQIQNHVAVEQFNITNAANQSVIKNEKSFAIDNFTDPLTIEKSKQTIIATVKTLGASQGWPDEMVQAKTHDELSSMHIGVIQNLVTVDSNAAEEYFETNKAEINQTNMNKYKLDRNIKAYQKENSEAIQDSIYDKLFSEDYQKAIAEINAANKPIENGGVGSQKALALKNSVEKSQSDRIKEILNKELDSDYSGYIDMVDKIAGDDDDKFAVKQFIVDKYADNYYTKSEKTDIKKALDTIREIRKQKGKWYNFKKNYDKLKIKLGGVEDAGVASALSKLIQYGMGLDKPPEELDAVTDEIIREGLDKKHPNLQLKSIPKDGKLKIDALGNKAIVYSDGSYKEIK